MLRLFLRFSVPPPPWPSTRINPKLDFKTTYFIQVLHLVHATLEGQDGAFRRVFRQRRRVAGKNQASKLCQFKRIEEFLDGGSSNWGRQESIQMKKDTILPKAVWPLTRVLAILLSCLKMTSMTQLSPLSLAIVIKPLRIKGFFPALERHRLPELRLFTAFMRTALE